MRFQAAVIPFVAVGVLGHAVVETPTPRKPGTLSAELCGPGLSAALERDLAGPLEAAVEDADETYDCNPYVCRGYQYEDNEADLHTFTVGEVVDFHIDLVAGHRPGYANVSVIDPVGNVILGDPLKTWESWPVENPGEDRDDINFSVTIPESLAETCTEGGKCAIQWYWLATKGPQTYESCVDFVIGA